MSDPVHPFRQADLADRKRAIEDNLALKSSKRPKVDNQGRPLDPPKLFRYDRLGKLVGSVDPVTGKVDPEPPAE